MSNKRRKPAARKQPAKAAVPAPPKPSPGAQRRAKAAAKSAPKKRTGLYFAIVGAAAILVIGALALVGGSDDTADPNVASANIEFVGTDFAFGPTTIKGLAGEIEVTLVNDGPAVHNLAILREGTEISVWDEHTDDMDLAFIPLLSPGDEASTTVSLDVGTYQVVCLIPGHLAAGMQADLIVEEAPVTTEAD